MRRLRLPALVVLAALTAGGCGGTTSPGETTGAAVVETRDAVTTDTTPAVEGSIGALIAEDPAPDVAITFGTSDFAVGDNRISFLVVDEDGELVRAPTARFRVAKGDSLDAVPTIETEATDIDVGLDPQSLAPSDFDAPSVYVVDVHLDEPGTYMLLAEPQGMEIQAVGQIEVAQRSAAPAVGTAAPASDNPTVADAFPKDITTATPPDVEMLQYSIAQSLEEKVPFVVTFATPKFCQSRVCGPVVNIVDAVRQRFEGRGIRFIHVEIYEQNDPQLGFNKWVNEWNLPTEPYTFLVGSDGVIKGRFEGLVTVSELSDAVERLLLP